MSPRLQLLSGLTLAVIHCTWSNFWLPNSIRSFISHQPKKTMVTTTPIANAARQAILMALIWLSAVMGFLVDLPGLFGFVIAALVWFYRRLVEITDDVMEIFDIL